MPPKKRGAKAAHHQQQPQPAVQSDYDTDTAAFTDNVSSVPTAAPPKRTNTELNLTVLRRYVPDIERIVQIAPFAVLYTFSAETGGWEKSGTEGTLFVCQLHGVRYQRYSVVILNRKSLENFVLELVSAEDVEVADGFVILQLPSEEDEGVPQVYGLWIFSDEETSGPNTMEMMAMSIQECAVRAEQGRKLAAVGNGDALEEQDYEEVGVEAAEATYEQPYGTSAPIPEMTHTAAHVQPQQQSTPQQLDVLSLFGKPQVQQETHIPEVTPPPIQHVAPVQKARTAQQNGLLSLFDSSQTQHGNTLPNVPHEAASHPQATRPQPAGQQLDLLQLFGNAQAPSRPPQRQQLPQWPLAPTANEHINPAPEQEQQPRFASNPDTDFFRTLQSPAQMQHPQAQAPPSQQNALLDLFKR